ncbi:MAG: hypothetical protein JXA00_02845 [Candidatus Thermoplasmatota archaeon]|nr:hypothetical protein [Candidatus Thermoplasmatota archaeon]
MNRQQLTYVRVVALMMAGLVATLTICNLFTIATKGISVHLPTEEDIHWSVDPTHKEILFHTTFSVNNQGAYDIKGIDISAQLVKDAGIPLITFEKHDMAVLRGSNTTFDLLIPINLDTVSVLDWFSIMYRNTTLQLLIDIDALYMFGLIEFTANEAMDVPWSPPLHNISTNTTVLEGLQGVSSLLCIAQNTSLASLSDILSLLLLPELSLTTENGFSFSLTLTPASDTMKNITCHIIAPLLITSCSFEFMASFLIGYEADSPVFIVQGVSINYVP